MSFDLAPFLADVKAQVAAVWPEVVEGGGILEAEHANMIPWTALELPYAVILITSLPQAQWGRDALSFEPVVQVWYVDQTRGKSVALRLKLADLVNHFWPEDPLTHGQVLDVGDLSWSDQLVPNELFRAANRNQRAGVVSLRCLVEDGGA